MKINTGILQSSKRERRHRFGGRDDRDQHRIGRVCFRLVALPTGTSLVERAKEGGPTESEGSSSFMSCRGFKRHRQRLLPSVSPDPPGSIGDLRAAPRERVHRSDWTSRSALSHAKGNAMEDNVSSTFRLDPGGMWICVRSARITIGSRTMQVQSGMTFTRGMRFMGVDVAAWLDKDSD